MKVNNQDPILISQVLGGDERALSRLLTALEEGHIEALEDLYPHTGKAHVIGITGSTGSGKSTLINSLVGEIRNRGKKVAVLAVDPNSPFTGGAILGDRVRMDDHFDDRGVFIRSMGSRGRLGGISESTRDGVMALDAFGFDWVIVETIGAGQAEVDIATMSDTTILVFPPNTGDDIQMMKAGILEIGDIFVVSKADLNGSSRTRMELETSVRMNKKNQHGWHPPVVSTSKSGKGITELMDAVEAHINFLRTTGLIAGRRRDVFQRNLVEITVRKVKERIISFIQGGKGASPTRDAYNRKKDPYSAADEVIDGVLKEWYEDRET